MKEKLNWLLHAVVETTWTLLSIYFSFTSFSFISESNKAWIFTTFFSSHILSRLFGFFTCSTFIMSHKGHKRVSMMISHLPWIEEKLMCWWLFVNFFYTSFVDKFSFVSSSIAVKKKSFSISSNLWISQEKFNLFLTCVPTSPWCLPIASMYQEVIIKQIENKYSHYYLLTWLLMLLRLNFFIL